MPASPITAKTRGDKIRATGQVGGKHFGTNSSTKQVGRPAAGGESQTIKG